MQEWSMKGASLGQALALLKTLDQGRKNQPGTNNLAYYDIRKLKNKKFQNIGPWQCNEPVI